MGEVWKHVITFKFKVFLDKVGYLDPFNSGFRPSYGMETALVTLASNLYKDI